MVKEFPLIRLINTSITSCIYLVFFGGGEWTLEFYFLSKFQSKIELLLVSPSGFHCYLPFSVDGNSVFISVAQGKNLVVILDVALFHTCKSNPSGTPVVSIF